MSLNAINLSWGLTILGKALIQWLMSLEEEWNLNTKINTEDDVTIRRKKAVRRQRQRLNWWVFRPRNDKDCWQPSETRVKACGDFPLTAFRRGWSANTLISNFKHQNCERIGLFCFDDNQFVVLCYNSHRKLIQDINKLVKKRNENLRRPCCYRGHGAYRRGLHRLLAQLILS